MGRRVEPRAVEPDGEVAAMTCLQILRLIRVPCQQCGAAEEHAHLIAVPGRRWPKLLCARCCPTHATAKPLPDRDVRDLNGVQKRFW